MASARGESGVEALVYYARRDLLGEKVGPACYLWDLAEVSRLLRKQRDDGSFGYLGRKAVVYPSHHYALLETWKQFRYLVEQYGFTKKHPAGERAAEFLFSCQTEAGVPAQLYSKP